MDTEQTQYRANTHHCKAAASSAFLACVMRDFLRAAVFLWITPLDTALSISEKASESSVSTLSSCSGRSRSCSLRLPLPKRPKQGGQRRENKTRADGTHAADTEVSRWDSLARWLRRPTGPSSPASPPPTCAPVHATPGTSINMQSARLASPLPTSAAWGEAGPRACWWWAGSTPKPTAAPHAAVHGTQASHPVVQPCRLADPLALEHGELPRDLPRRHHHHRRAPDARRARRPCNDEAHVSRRGARRASQRGPASGGG